MILLVRIIKITEKWQHIILGTFVKLKLNEN